MNTGAIRVIRSGREGSASGVTRTEVGETVVATNRLHIGHAAFASEIAGSGEVDFERFGGCVMSGAENEKQNDFFLHFH